MSSIVLDLFKENAMKALAVLYILFFFPGYPFALLLSRLVTMGDGTGNESSIIAFQLWSVLFGVLVWVLVVFGCVWLSNHVSISFH
jgi:hypothetical protein